MAKSVLDIIIKLSKQGGADKETVRGLVSIKSAIMGTAAVAGTLIAAGYAIKKVFDATAGALVAYADQVRRLSDATGASSEDTSKLIQVLDDMKISYEEIEKAVAKSGKTFDFSIEGIAKMSDAYLELTNTQDQAAFMQERFGKNWISFVPAMEKGGAALRDMSDAVKESLILNRKAMDETREYEIATDLLSEAWEGYKLTIGKALVGPATGLLNIINASNEAEIRLAKEGLIPGTEAYRRRKYELINTVKAEQEAAAAILMQTGALDGNTTSAEENAAALKLISDANASILKGAIDLTKSNEDFQLSQEEILKKAQELQEEKAGLYAWESEKIAGIDKDLEALRDQYTENQDKFRDAMNEKFALMAIEKIAMSDGVAGYSDAEMAKATAVLQTMDVVTAAALGEQLAMELLTSAVADGRINVEQFGDIVDRSMADGVISIGEVTSAIEAIPSQKTITLNVVQLGGYNPGTAGYQHIAHPGRAAGGPVSAGRTYMVGEKGPELFKPGQSGSIIPNGGGGGNVYYNIGLTISSPMTIMDEQTAQKTLLPFIINGIRQAQAKGSIR